jgi:Na+/H+-dicarboxylate symporter
VLRLALHWQILIAMVLGAALGVLLNTIAGERQSPRPIRLQRGPVLLHGMAAPARVPRGTVWIEDTSDQILMQINERQPDDSYRSRRVVVRGPLPAQNEEWSPLPPQSPGHEVPTRRASTLDDLQVSDPAAYAIFRLHGRSTARWVGDMARDVGDLFLRMLKMVSIPLIITSLLTGVTGLGQADRVGRMFGRTVSYYICTSMIAICVGLLMVNTIRPGLGPGGAGAGGVPVEAPAEGEGKSLGTVLFEQLENMIPPNPLHAATNGEFLSVIAFTIAFGIFTLLAGGRTAERISGLATAAFEVMMRMTMAIIYLAPLGVFFLILAATAAQGVGVFLTLGRYLVTVACALSVHAVVVLPLILWGIARRSPRLYMRAMSPALLTAFSSASSNGTLPLTLSCAEERAGINNRVSSFVLPLGATVNMDGTALYEVVAVLFIAQYHGVQLGLAQQLIVALTALLASIGAAGIPHAGLVMMVIILQAVGLPVETQGLILAVDRVLDMGRTAVNVWSDSCGCAVVDRFESALT